MLSDGVIDKSIPEKEPRHDELGTNGSTAMNGSGDGKKHLRHHDETSIQLEKEMHARTQRMLNTEAKIHDQKKRKESGNWLSYKFRKRKLKFIRWWHERGGSAILYSPPTRQHSWAATPHNVSISTALWIDVVFVGVLYRLNAFILNRIQRGSGPYWPTIPIFIALYDCWCASVFFESTFQSTQMDLAHSAHKLLGWVLIALMATTLNNDTEWIYQDCTTFGSLKVVHSFLGALLFVETIYFSPSRKARAAAVPRLTVWSLSFPFLVLSPLLAGTQAVSTDVASLFWIVAYLIQRVGAYLWVHEECDPTNHSSPYLLTNQPYVARRYNEWFMVQLATCCLVLIVIPEEIMNNFEGNTYATCIFGYILLAGIQIINYSSNPPLLSDHALFQSKRRRFVWIELNSLSALSLVGLSIGIKSIFFRDDANFDALHLVWVLSVCVFIVMSAMMMQELLHRGTSRRVGSGKALALKLALMVCLFVPPSIISASAQLLDEMWLLLVCLVVVWLLIFVQYFTGAFRKQVAKQTQISLRGHFLAIIIARTWLQRTRANRLKRMEGNVPAIFSADNLPSLVASAAPMQDDARINASTMSNNTTRMVDSLKSLAPMDNGANVDVKDVILDAADEVVGEEYDRLAEEVDEELENSEGTAAQDAKPTNDRRGKRKRRLSLAFGSVFTKSSFGEGGEAGIVEGKKPSGIVVQVRVLTRVLNASFYQTPHAFAVGDMFADREAHWADLFFDVLYIGVMFRLGDFLLYGLDWESSKYARGSTSARMLADAPVGNATKSNNSTSTISFPASEAVFLYVAVFIAVMSMWQTKMSYACKVGVSDMAHKLVDVLQGLCILLCALNIGSPSNMAKNALGSAYIFAGALLAFHTIVLCLWGELYFRTGRYNASVIHMAKRNGKRQVMSMVPIVASFLCIGLKGPLWATTLLWLLSWVVPFAERIATTASLKPEFIVPYLQKYQLHRLGDAALFTLGEGVLQIIRTPTKDSSIHYAVFSLSFICMSAIRDVVFSSEPFHNPKKHALSLSRVGALVSHLWRTLTYPTVVCIGVGFKKVVGSATAAFDKSSYYWLVCAPSAIAALLFCFLFETHRWSGKREIRAKTLAEWLFASSLFWLLPWPPITEWLLALLVLFAWLFVSACQYYNDDYIHLIDHNLMQRGTSGYEGTDGAIASTTVLGHSYRPETLNRQKSTRKLADLLKEFGQEEQGELQQIVADKHSKIKSFRKGVSSVRFAEDDAQNGGKTAASFRKQNSSNSPSLSSSVNGAQTQQNGDHASELLLPPNQNDLTIV